MIDELRDYTTPPCWTVADADALLDVALAWDDCAFLPADQVPPDARPRPEPPAATSITWADILAMCERITTAPWPLPRYPQDWDLSPAGLPPVLSTTVPFTIRYAATVWEQLHPIGKLLRRPIAPHYLPNPRSNHHRHPRNP